MATLPNGYSATCPWLVLVPSGCLEPDSEADRWREVECGAVMREDRDGAICEAGHEFGNLEARLAPFGPEWEAEQADRLEATGGWW